MATVKVTRKQAQAAAAAVDWAALDAMTDEQIAEQIAADPDVAPDLTAERVKRVFIAHQRTDNVHISKVVRLLRRSLGMSQAEFASAYHLPIRTLQNWEQGMRKPDPATIALIKLIVYEPRRVRKILADET
jgi:putative transcriptional regulator